MKKTKEFRLEICEQLSQIYNNCEQEDFVEEVTALYHKLYQSEDTVSYGPIIAYRVPESQTKWRVIDARNGWGAWLDETIDICENRKISLYDILVYAEHKLTEAQAIEETMNKLLDVIDNYK